MFVSTARLSRMFSRSTSNRETPRRNRAASGSGPRLLVEQCEGRQLFSAAPLVHAAQVSGIVSPSVINQALHKPVAAVQSVLPVKITGITASAGQLLASGLIGSNPFTAPLTLSLANPTTSPSAAVPILDLSLGPIHLNVLGLHVDTSKICLDIAAQPGPGNLLGNLLSGVANLLNQGNSLSTILGGLGADLNNLLSGLTNLLNGALGKITAPTSVVPGTAGTPATAANTTNILNLSLGPVDLNLLGLTVSLDNCANGPVTVDVTAVSGPGNLLGNLLGDVSHLLDANALTRLTSQILTLI